MGQIAPLDDLRFTDGMCEECEIRIIAEEEAERIRSGKNTA